MAANLSLEQAEQVEQLANEILVGDLEAVGNVLSPLHKEALRTLLQEMTGFAVGRVSGRHSFSLGTGCGKTSAIIAWVTALHRLGLHQVAVSVSASKIEALCDLKRQLLKHGVPEKLVGLKHSDPRASMPSTDDEDRLYQLVTHARVRGGGDRPLFIEHKGQPRALMVYDESLIRSDTEVISERRLRKQFAAFREHVRGRPEESQYLPLFEFVEQATEKIRCALQQCRTQPQHSPIITIDAPDSVTIDGFKSLLGRSEEWESIRRLLDVVGVPLRLMLTAQAEGIVRYQISVPAELENVLILDASYPIRELVQLDASIIDSTPSYVRDVKRFDDVVIHQMRHGSGREATTKNFAKARFSDRTISREVIKILEQIHPDKAVLIFTFKHHPGEVNIPETLLRDMASAGIDIDSKSPEGKPRINILTWGDETSLNHYSHCEVVILAGILHLPQLQVASHIIGQQDNLALTTTQQQVDSVCDSEMAHRVYQALSRGSCRTVENGQAKPMTVYLLHHRDHLKAALESVMPGVVWKAWLPTFVTDDGHHCQVDILAMRMMSYLDQQPQEKVRIKTRDLRSALGLDLAVDRLRKLFDRAVDKVCQSGLWVRHGHALMRMGAMFT